MPAERPQAPRDEAWDAFVSRSGGSYAQSSAWAGVKAVAGWRGARVHVDERGEIEGGCQLLLREVPGIGTIAYASRGPVLRRPDDDGLANRVLDALDAFGEEHHLAYVKMQGPSTSPELPSLLTARGWVDSGLDAGPGATVLVDLEGDDAEILGRMRSSMRRHVSKALSGPLRARFGGYAEIDRFWSLVEQTSGRQGFDPFPAAYYREIWRAFGPDDVALVLVEREDELLSAMFVFGFGETAVYKMGAWSGAASNLHPNELGHWVAMRWARDRGYRYYDLDGIDPEIARAALAGTLSNESRKGTAQFKLGFGGRLVFAPRTCDRTYRRLYSFPLRFLAPRLREGRFSFRAVGRAA